MNGQLIQWVRMMWPLLPGLIFSILTIINLTKKNRAENSLYVLSNISLCIFAVLFGFSIFFIMVGLEAGILFIIGFPISLALIFSYLSSLYFSTTYKIKFQKVRNIILWAANILYLISLVLVFIRPLILDLSSGMILGVSNSTALAEAKNQLNPNVKYGECAVGEKVDWYENGQPAHIAVYCDVYFDNTSEIFMSKEVLINARTGKVTYRDDVYKAKVVFKKDGKPMANTHFFSGVMEEESRGGDFLDYSVTDSNGEANLLFFPDHKTRVYSLDYKYIDYDGPKKDAIDMNWDNPKQLPKGGLLFQKDPYGKSYYSPYEDHSKDVTDLPIEPSSAEWNIYRNNRTNYQIEYPSSGLALDLNETVKYSEGGENPNYFDVVQFATDKATYAVRTFPKVQETSIEDWLTLPENYEAIGSDLNRYEKTTLGTKTAYKSKEGLAIFGMNEDTVFIIISNTGSGLSTDTNDPIFSHLVSSFLYTRK